MRPVLLLLSICSTSVATIQLDERRASTLDTSILLDLPPCLLQCVTELLPQFNCSSAECFCDAKGLLKDRMTACTTSACTNLDDELKGVRLQAEICGWKPHTDAPPTEDTAYGLFTVVAIFVLARLLYRLPQLGGVGYGWDDYTLILCFPAAVGMTVTAHYAAEYGSGKDLWLLSAEELQHFFIWIYAGEPLYPIVTCLTKVSLVLLYLRIWTEETLEERSRFRLACWTTLGILLAAMVSFVFTSLFACSPIEGGWNLHTGKDVKCINRTAQGYSLGAINIVLDFVVLLLPVPRLLKLNINLGEKIGVLTTFLLGFLVTICSIVRMFYIYHVANVTNITYSYSFVGLWSLVEVYCTMICCCVPAAAGLVRRYWRRIAKNLWSVVTNLGTSTRREEMTQDTEMMWTGGRNSVQQVHEMDAGVDGVKGDKSGYPAKASHASDRASPHHFTRPYDRDEKTTKKPENSFTIFPYPSSNASVREGADSPEFWYYDRPDGTGAGATPGHRPTKPIPARFSDIGGLSSGRKGGPRR